MLLFSSGMVKFLSPCVYWIYYYFQSVDIIRPICQLLNFECAGLENFEALLALGNLATVNESCRSRILKETEFLTAIEGYMFEDHTQIRR